MDSQRQHVFVVGGTGRTGSRLVRRLCMDPKFDVTVLARDLAKAQELQARDWPKPVRVVQGDLGDVNAFSELCGHAVATAVSCGVRTRESPLAALGYVTSGIVENVPSE